MQHPFIDPASLEKLTLDELQEKVTGIFKMITFADRTNNQNLLNQLYMALDSYTIEYNKRMDEIYRKQNIEAQINITDKP